MAEDRPRETVLLRAGDVIASIDPGHGGRLLSLAVDGVELLEPPRPYAGAIPTYGSFLLAPWVGELFEGRLRFADRDYRLPRNVGRHAAHGLVLDGPWEVEFQSGSELRIRRELGPPWPFGGVVRQQFVLEADGLRQTAEVESAGSAMPVAMGWHPWFRASDRGSVRARVDAAHYAELDVELIPTGVVVPVSGDVDLRRDESFGDRRIDVVYVDATSPARLTIGGRELSIAFDPLISTLVVYSAQDTICIEPWTSWPDAVRGSARGLPTGNVVLQPHETMRRWTRWSWSRTSTP